MTTIKRISQLIDYQGVKVTALEREIGASKGVLSKAIKNNTEISIKWVKLIHEKYPKYNLAWLLGLDTKDMLRQSHLRMRISLVIKHVRGGYEGLLKKTGLEDNVSFSNIEIEITNDELVAILKAYTDIDPVWLFTGIGQMLVDQSTNKEIKLLEARIESLKRENELLEELLSVYKNKENIKK